MKLWVCANPLLFMWAVGVYYGKWNNGLSIAIVAAMYFFFFVTGAFGLIMADGIAIANVTGAGVNV